jgi:CRP-like cAMP-binding protein
VIPSHVKGVSFFEGIPETDVELLSKKFVRQSFLSDTEIFGQGDAAHRLYILISGNVSIEYKPDDGEVLRVSEIEPKGVFGWSAALGRNSYTSSATTTEDSHVLSILGNDLRELCSSSPDIGVVILERLAGVIAERLESTHEQIVELLWKNINSGNER